MLYHVAFSLPEHQCRSSLRFATSMEYHEIGFFPVCLPKLFAATPQQRALCNVKCKCSAIWNTRAWGQRASFGCLRQHGFRVLVLGYQHSLGSATRSTVSLVFGANSGQRVTQSDDDVISTSFQRQHGSSDAGHTV